MIKWLLKKFPNFSEWLRRRYFRVSGADQRDDKKCDWCCEVKTTTVSEVWSRAYPAGVFYRTCEDCSAGCAGG